MVSLRPTVVAGRRARYVISQLDRMPQIWQKIYLKPWEKPPDGVLVQRGPQGGRFFAYLPGDKAIQNWLIDRPRLARENKREENRRFREGGGVPAAEVPRAKTGPRPKWMSPEPEKPRWEPPQRKPRPKTQTDVREHRVEADKLKQAVADANENVTKAKRDLEFAKGKLARRLDRFANGANINDELDEWFDKLKEHRKEHDDAKVKQNDAEAALNEHNKKAPKGPVNENLGPVAGPADARSVKSFTELGYAGGIHGSRTYQADMNPGFWESVQGLHPTKALYKMNDQPGGRRFHESPNEMATWLVDKTLGLNVSPEVRYADLTDKGSGGHIMRWIDHSGEDGSTMKLATHYFVGGRKLKKQSMKNDLVRLYALDIISGNSDRHQNNWAIDETAGRVWAIDNGYTFAHNGHQEVGHIRHIGLRMHPRGWVDNLDEGMEEEFKRVQDAVRERHDDLIDAIGDVFDGPERERAQRGLNSRIEAFLALKDLASAGNW